MNTFIGTKLVKAEAMTRLEYNIFRGWLLPFDENGADPGYLVEYLDGGAPNTLTHTGYVSWSPKKQFEDAYRETSGMSFGLALEAMRRGDKVVRAGWNGKDMCVYLVDGAYNFNDYMVIRGVNGSLSTWVPSVGDCLAEDWSIVSQP